MHHRAKTQPSEADLRLLAFIIQFHDATGLYPTTRQMATKMGYTRSNVQAKLRTLRRFGCLDTGRYLSLAKQAYQLCNLSNSQNDKR